MHCHRSIVSDVERALSVGAWWGAQFLRPYLKFKNRLDRHSPPPPPLSVQRVVRSYQRVTLKCWKQENLPPQGLLFRHSSQGPCGTSHELVACYTSSATRSSSTPCIFIKSQPGFQAFRREAFTRASSAEYQAQVWCRGGSANLFVVVNFLFRQGWVWFSSYYIHELGPGQPFTTTKLSRSDSRYL